MSVGSNKLASAGAHPGKPVRPPFFVFGLALLCLFGAIVFLTRNARIQEDRKTYDTNSSSGLQGPAKSPILAARETAGPSHPLDNELPGPKEIVAAKVAQFASNRLDVVRRMARQRNVELPESVTRFFEAVAGGNWEEIQTLHDALFDERKHGGWSAGQEALWGPLHETYGVAEQAHVWPPQQLLDYGNAILGSLRPGMVYVGGTDSGRFIPTLMNETTDGEQHVILTQNALADASYLQYLSFLYGDRLQTLTSEDSQRNFQDYLSDAQKRLSHDQQAPGEPKQIRPGEDIRTIENRIQVSGQVAVMAINEKLLQTLMAKNPDATFAIEQSFPFSSTYPDASTLGPIMEMRVNDNQNALTTDRATEAVDYWRNMSQQLLSDPESASSRETLQAWSKMADDQAALLLDRKFPAQAEDAFRIANEICPWSPESVFRYVNLLLSQNRISEAFAVADRGARADPANNQMRDLVLQLTRMQQR